MIPTHYHKLSRAQQLSNLSQLDKRNKQGVRTQKAKRLARLFHNSAEELSAIAAEYMKNNKHADNL